MKEQEEMSSAMSAKSVQLLPYTMEPQFLLALILMLSIMLGLLISIGAVNSQPPLPQADTETFSTTLPPPQEANTRTSSHTSHTLQEQPKFTSSPTSNLAFMWKLCKLDLHQILIIKNSLHPIHYFNI